MAEKVDRLTRVNELIKRELANYLEKFPVEAAENMLVSITEVNTSVDLRNATVSISIFGGKNSNRAEVFKELNSKRSDMQRVLARTLAFKHTPVLAFKPDRRLEMGDRVLALLNDPE
ncbi:MAG: 30S ribosome-binding factor RbfA [Lentisphaerae bacterium]|nr:30S ribosome-binding factor RbfA [Lentisphaerota bacterium]